jgi:hypothetical protein
MWNACFENVFFFMLSFLHEITRRACLSVADMSLLLDEESSLSAFLREKWILNKTMIQDI